MEIEGTGSATQAILSTGKAIKINDGFIGLSGNRIGQGYDGDFRQEPVYDFDPQSPTHLTMDEQLEIAAYMINQWQDLHLSLRLKRIGDNSGAIWLDPGIPAATTKVDL